MIPTAKVAMLRTLWSTRMSVPSRMTPGDSTLARPEGAAIRAPLSGSVATRAHDDAPYPGVWRDKDIRATAGAGNGVVLDQDVRGRRNKAGMANVYRPLRYVVTAPAPARRHGVATQVIPPHDDVTAAPDRQ